MSTRFRCLEVPKQLLSGWGVFCFLLMLIHSNLLLPFAPKTHFNDFLRLWPAWDTRHGVETFILKTGFVFQSKSKFLKESFWLFRQILLLTAYIKELTKIFLGSSAFSIKLAIPHESSYRNLAEIECIWNHFCISIFQTGYADLFRIILCQL